MNLEAFRKNEKLVAWWSKTYGNSNFGELLKMLEQDHPLRSTDDRTRFSSAAAENYLGVIQGYELVLERLKLATQYTNETNPLLEAKFEPVDTETIT